MLTSSQTINVFYHNSFKFTRLNINKKILSQFCSGLITHLIFMSLIVASFSRVKTNKNYYVVINARWARSRTAHPQLKTKRNLQNASFPLETFGITVEVLENFWKSYFYLVNLLSQIILSVSSCHLTLAKNKYFFCIENKVLKKKKEIGYWWELLCNTFQNSKI